MSRVGPVLAAAVVALAPLPGTTAGGQDLPVDPPGFVHQANASSYDGQGFFGQDALYDDQGEDSGGDTASTLTGFEGDAYFGQFGGRWSGVGDIRSVRVRPVVGDPDAVRVEVTMNSLRIKMTNDWFGPREYGVDPLLGPLTKQLHPVVFVGVDDGPGGFSAWPHGAMLSTPGLDSGYTLTFDEFGSHTDGGPPQAAGFTKSDHTLSVTVDGLRSQTPRFIVGAGEWDAARQTWKPQMGSPRPVLDLALSCPLALRPEIVKPTRDDAACEWAQSSELAFPEATHSSFTIDLGLLDDVVPATPPAEGFASYVFTSAVDNGDGYYLYYGNPQFLGTAQAFTVALPSGWASRQNQLVVYLHGAGAWGAYQSEQDGWTSTIAASGRIVLFPYGRGPASWYLPAGEADVLEVIAAAESLFPIDPDRRVLTGLSMGGFGTYRIAFMHPDLFAGAVLYMATNNNEYSRGSADASLPLEDTDVVTPNAFNLPILLLAGTEQTFHEMAARRALLDQLGYEHTFKLFPDPVHFPDFPQIVAAHVVAWLDALPARTENPREIRYRTVPGWLPSETDHPYRSADGLVRYDRAWWLSGIEARTGVAVAEVVATSEAIPVATTAFPAFGPAPDIAGPSPLPVAVSGRTRTQATVVTAQRATLALTGVGAITLDLARMGLLPGASVEIASDGPVVVSSTGGSLCGSPPCALAGTATMVVS